MIFKQSITRASLVAVTAALAVTMLVMTSCNKEEKTVTPAPPENEFITTVVLKCVNAADTADTQTATWRDLTPDDTNPPDTSQAILNLKKNATYYTTVTLLDETKNPIANISDEILQRGNYHLFCFTASPTLGSNLTVTRTDHDTNNPPLPIGLTDDLTTVNVSTGLLNVILRHQPNVKNGSCDPGSTDLDVNFTVNIIN